MTTPVVAADLCRRRVQGVVVFCQSGKQRFLAGGVTASCDALFNIRAGDPSPAVLVLGFELRTGVDSFGQSSSQ